MGLRPPTREGGPPSLLGRATVGPTGAVPSNPILAADTLVLLDHREQTPQRWDNSQQQ
jgi:hypothetical protein